MNWIKVQSRHLLPKDKPFFAIWKGAFCIAQFDEDEGRFYMCHNPAYQAGIMRVALEREEKFSHYCLIDYPQDYWDEPRTEK